MRCTKERGQGSMQGVRRRSATGSAWQCLDRCACRCLETMPRGRSSFAWSQSGDVARTTRDASEKPGDLAEHGSTQGLVDAGRAWHLDGFDFPALPARVLTHLASQPSRDACQAQQSTAALATTSPVFRVLCPAAAAGLTAPSPMLASRPGERNGTGTAIATPPEPIRSAETAVPCEIGHMRPDQF